MNSQIIDFVCENVGQSRELGTFRRPLKVASVNRLFAISARTKVADSYWAARSPDPEGNATWWRPNSSRWFDNSAGERGFVT
jgi:hypothetical protein